MIKQEKQQKKPPIITIGIIMQTPDIGGAEMYMLSLIDNFIIQKHKVTFASNLDKLLIKVNDKKVVAYKIPIILDIIGNYKGLLKSILSFLPAMIFYIKLLKKFKNEYVNVILMSGFSEKLLVTFISVFFNIPVVWIEYGPLETIFSKNFYLPEILYKIFKKIPKYIIVPSQITRKSLIKYAGLDPSKIILIPCGIKIQNKNKKILNNIFPLTKNLIIVGSVSRLTREKGQQHLIYSAPLILKKHPETKFLIIGDGPDKNYFKELVEKLKLQDTIKFTGFVKDVYDYYPLMDIFVFPTVWELEGFGLVMPEAMSNGLPVIASNTGPIPEIIGNNIDGILVPPGSSSEIAKAVVELISKKQKRIKFGERAKNKVSKNYDIKIISQKVTKILQIAATTN